MLFPDLACFGPVLFGVGRPGLRKSMLHSSGLCCFFKGSRPGHLPFTPAKVLKDSIQIAVYGLPVSSLHSILADRRKYSGPEAQKNYTRPNAQSPGWSLSHLPGSQTQPQPWLWEHLAHREDDPRLQHTGQSSPRAVKTGPKKAWKTSVNLAPQALATELGQLRDPD